MAAFSDRVVVLRDGQVHAVLGKRDITMENLTDQLRFATRN
jgi:hypothetical protein